MPQKKTENKPQSKTLFDHLKQVTNHQSPDYFKTLTDSDKRIWSTFMILRYLSMNPDWIDAVNDIQPLTTSVQLKSELAYQLLIAIIPSSNIYLQYIKGSKEIYNEELIKLLMTHYTISEKEAIDYLKILHPKNSINDEGMNEIVSIAKSYGYEDKEIKKIIKLK